MGENGFGLDDDSLDGKKNSRNCFDINEKAITLFSRKGWIFSIFNKMKHCTEKNSKLIYSQTWASDHHYVVPSWTFTPWMTHLLFWSPKGGHCTQVWLYLVHFCSKESFEANCFISYNILTNWKDMPV